MYHFWLSGLRAGVRGRSFLAVFVLGFIGLPLAGSPQHAALLAGLLIFSVCRYLEGQSRVLQTAASRTLIG